MRNSVTFLAYALLSVATLVNCGGGGGGALNPQPSPQVSPSVGPSPVSGPRLYAVNSKGAPAPAKEIDAFGVPLSSSSTTFSTTTTGLNNPLGVGVDPTDSSHFFVANNGGGNVQIYNRPVTQAATLAGTITGFASPPHGGNPTDVAFDTAGNMFVADIDRIWKLAHPVGAASVPTAIITTNLALATCVALDATGHLYVGDAGAVGATGKLLSYAAPYTGAPVTTQNGILATDAIITCAVQPGTNRIFIANVSSGGSIVGYDTPLAANASPAITITNAAGVTPGGIAFDSSGALYVGFSQTGSTGISAYAAPLGSSTPTFTFPNAGFFATGLAFSP